MSSSITFGPSGILIMTIKKPVTAIQYQARNIVLNQLSFKKFNKAGPAIKVFGGENRADIIKIQNVTTDDSFAKVIEIGSDITEITIEK